MSKTNVSTKIDDSYFSTIHQSNNVKCDYNFEPPIYGPSNTDQSYYEPQSTRIANMRKSASGLSTGAYDFSGEKNINPKDIDLRNFSVPVGRALGLTFEEVSQIQTNNANNIISQSKEEEERQKSEKASKEQMLKDSVEISQAISNSNFNSEE